MEHRTTTGDLRDEISRLNRLDELRKEVKKMRDSAIQALLRLQHSTAKDPEFHKKSPDWDLGTSHAITTLLLARATQKVERAGLTAEEQQALSGTNWPRVTLAAGSTEASKNTIHLLNDPLAVFSASSYVRARLDDGAGFISKEVLLCLYVMVMELYSIEGPDFAIGGARAGLGKGNTSPYVTMEVARSIGYLKAILERTADFLKEMDACLRYVHHVKAGGTSAVDPTFPIKLPESWTRTELHRSLESIRTMLMAQSGRILLPVGDLVAMEDPIAVERALRARIKSFADRTADQIAKATIDSHRWRIPILAGGMAERFIEIFMTDLGELGTKLKGLANTKATLEPTELFKRLETVLRTAAEMVRGLLDPVEKYMNGELNALLLYTADEEESTQLQDLIFAASTSGAIAQNWHASSFRRIGELLERSIDQYGQLPIGSPFHMDESNADRYPINGHSIRAMAHLFTRTQYKPKLETVDRMVQAFRGYSTVTGGIGWKRNATTKRAKASPWVSAVNVLALGRLARMLDEQINNTILSHFDTSRPTSPTIDRLMCSDIGVASMEWPAGRHRRMITHDLEIMHRRLIPQAFPEEDPWSSMILYGPPGTGKTTLAECLAASAQVPLVQVTPSDFLIGGEDAIEYRARTVMHALTLLTKVVILFDEFDSVITDREEEPNSKRNAPKNIFSFLTAAMLPKLADLNKAAKKNNSVYILATNFVERLDAAAIRPGRFDHKRGVYPPDMASRICRLHSQLRLWKAKQKQTFLPGWEDRMMNVVVRTAGVPMSQLIRPGWFTMLQRGPIPPRSGGFAATAFDYIATGGDLDIYPMPSALQVPNTAAGENHFKNNLEVDQEFELDLVMTQNRDALAKLNAQGKKGSHSTRWNALVKLANTDRTNLREGWKAANQTMRNKRLGQRDE